MSRTDEENLKRIGAWAAEEIYLDNREIIELVKWLAAHFVDAAEVVEKQTKVILEQQKMLDDLSARIRTVDLLRQMASKKESEV